MFCFLPNFSLKAVFLLLPSGIFAFYFVIELSQFAPLYLYAHLLSLFPGLHASIFWDQFILLKFICTYISIKNALEVNFLWPCVFENLYTFTWMTICLGIKFWIFWYLFLLVSSDTDVSMILFFIDTFFLYNFLLVIFRVLKFYTHVCSQEYFVVIEQSGKSLMLSMHMFSHIPFFLFSVCEINWLLDHLIWHICISYLPTILLFNYDDVFSIF